MNKSNSISTDSNQDANGSVSEYGDRKDTGIARVNEPDATNENIHFGEVSSKVGDDVTENKVTTLSDDE